MNALLRIFGHFILRFKPGRGITKTRLVIQRDASKWPGILKLITMTRVSAGSELSHTTTTRTRVKCHNHALSMKYSICNIHLLPKAADLRKKSV